MNGHPFYRLAPFIQEYIYRNRWDELRDAQVRALEAILDGQDHVLIAAGTASGKTEAAMFPVLTVLDQAKPDGFGAMYVGPLKALINDQFERVSALLRDQDIPLTAWHGDRSQQEKARSLKRPAGVLQITPESLEALLMNRAGDIPRLFGQLQFVIIDEVHAFMGQDRGLQLICQLVRLERLAGCAPRRIGLSATISDYGAAQAYLQAGTDRGVTLIESREGKRQLSLAMEHFAYPDPTDQIAYQAAQEAYNAHVYGLVRGRKCIVFTNSRVESEQCIDTCRHMAEALGDPDIYHVHHGAISASLRRDTELSLRNAPGPQVVAATLTLELGIDLGGLERVVQLGASRTCSSFVQRLGRSGRRGAPSEMRFVTTSQCDKGDAFARIPWALIQNIAVVQLYLEERWVEPFDHKPLPFSLLMHQTLSALSQREYRPSELARFALTLPPFAHVSNEDYRALLHHMLENDLIQRTEEGGLIVGLAGERLTNSYRFYAVFRDPAGYQVFHRQQEIGQLDALPQPHDILLLAGRRWRVLSTDPDRRQVYVESASSAKNAPWEAQGWADIHDRVVARMRQALVEDAQYPYLLPRAQDALNRARSIARQSGILDGPISARSQSLFLHPWLGTRKHNTLAHLLRHGPLGEILDVQAVIHKPQHLYTEIRCPYGPDQFLAALHRAIAPLSADDVPAPAHCGQDLYDRFLPSSLLIKAYRHNVLDLGGVQAAVAMWAGR